MASENSQLSINCLPPSMPTSRSFVLRRDYDEEQLALKKYNCCRKDRPASLAAPRGKQIGAGSATSTWERSSWRERMASRIAAVHIVWRAEWDISFTTYELIYEKGCKAAMPSAGLPMQSQR